jgi:hypothetical protein
MNINFDDYKLTASGVESTPFDYHCQTCNKKFKNKVQLIEVSSGIDEGVGVIISD